MQRTLHSAMSQENSTRHTAVPYDTYVFMIETKTVNLRDLPADLVRRAKAYAAWQGISLKQFIMQAIQQALDVAEQASGSLTPAVFVRATQHRKGRRKTLGLKMKPRQ